MDTSTRNKRIELRQAIIDLREHGLIMQAQWAAEQLAGLPADEDTSPLPPPCAPSVAQLDDAYLLARTHFDLKVRHAHMTHTHNMRPQEYRRCAHVLHGATDPLHVFLRCYATYLYGEKRKEYAVMRTLAHYHTQWNTRPPQGNASGAGCSPHPGPLCGHDSPQQPHARHPGAGTVRGSQQGHWGRLSYLSLWTRARRSVRVVQSHVSCAGVCAWISNWHQQQHSLHHAPVTCFHREQHDQARTVLVRSLQQYPCNWGAWKALEALCPDAATATALCLPRHWMRDLFLASLSLSLHDHAHALQRLEVPFVPIVSMMILCQHGHKDPHSCLRPLQRTCRTAPGSRAALQRRTTTSATLTRRRSSWRTAAQPIHTACRCM